MDGLKRDTKIFKATDDLLQRDIQFRCTGVVVEADWL